jgi:RNA polymerase sigma factor (sigma-70 family)
MDRLSHTLDDSPAMEMAADSSQSPEAMLRAQDRRRSVVEAVQELEEPLREVVVLHDYEGLDHKEIASTLGLSHDAVRKRYSRALATLALRLKEIVE